MTRNTILALVFACTANTVLAETFVVETAKARQTIRHFGASDAWSMQNIGLWPEVEEQERIADWLFSLETDHQGQPRGIGLSLWRFNLGAGSSEQGDSSYINKGTRTECLLQADGTWDWSRQEGQRRFLKMARERGVPHMLAFLNSPPVQFTLNGLATNTGRDGTLNLKADCYDNFALFMAKAVKGLEEHDGIHFDYLCPVNEPDGHWNWQGPKQEGSPATNREIARLARATSQALQQEGVSTELLVNESSDLRCLLGIYKTSWERGNTIRTLFSRDSTDTYLGETPQVPRLILGHSYWTNTPVRYMKRIRQELRDACQQYGIKFWQSEICIMSNDEEIGGGGGYDFTMKTGLYVARVIHHDLCYADAESWSWWRACGGNYKDGLIRVFDRQHRSRDSRLLWCMGNYSRFIRPGAVRHEVTGSKREDPYGVMVSAYKNLDGTWAVVAINYSQDDQPFSLSLSDSATKTTWYPYRTSDADGETLRPLPATDGTTTLAGRSITTFITKQL
jgi:O-glycosyl hydrolase